MAKRILNIVESAYRAVPEEQDDTALWITTVLKNNGGAVSLLLKGNAVSYLIAEQKAPALSFGAWRQSHPPDIAGDMKRLISSGTEVLYVEEDLADRGIHAEMILPGAKGVARTGVGRLFMNYDLVWHW